MERVFGANDNEASRKKPNKKGGARARMASQGQESAVGGKMGGGKEGEAWEAD